MLTGEPASTASNKQARGMFIASDISPEGSTCGHKECSLAVSVCL